MQRLDGGKRTCDAKTGVLYGALYGGHVDTHLQCNATWAYTGIIVMLIVMVRITTLEYWL